MKKYYVYILASKARGTLYIGLTNDLQRRCYQHRSGVADGFTKKYKVHRLVYCDNTNDVSVAISREKQLKNWRRQWKINLIEATNPQWEDLSLHYRIGSEINSE